MLAFTNLPGGPSMFDGMLQLAKKSALGNLSRYREWHKQSIYTDLAINLGLGLVGVAVAAYFWPAWPAFVGVVWALLNIMPIVTWAVGI
jgi:hypothetical protein